VETASRHSPSLSGFLFAFSATIGLLGVASTVVGYVIALARGGGPGVVRYAPWIATAGLAVAVVIAHHVVRHGNGRKEASTTSLTAGVGAAGGLTLIGTLAKDATDLSEFGPVQLAVAAIALLTVVLSPLAGRAMARHGLVDQFARLTTETRQTPIAGRSATTGLRSWELAAAVVGLIVLAASLAYVMSSGPLGHDESVYALKARAWYAGTPSTGFGIYRPPGMAAIGWVVVHFSESEVAFRSAALALSVGAVVVMWTAGRTMLSPAAAWVGAGVFVASASYLRRATEFLNDLTTAGLLLSAMLVIWYHFERRPGGWWIVAAAPLGAGAYYVRYGSAPGLVIIAIVAAAVWFKQLGPSWKQIVATAGVMAVLLVPHFLYAMQATGSLLGVFSSARTSVGGGGGGLADYVGWFPQRLAGSIGGALMIAGLIYTGDLVVRAIRDRQWSQRVRTAVFLVGTAVPFTIFLGAFTHGEPRFVFMPIMALLLLGGQAVVTLLFHLSTAPRRVTALVLGVAIFGAFVPGVGRMHNTTAAITSQFDVVVGAADAIRSDVGGGDCSIRSSYVPQLTWYSACATFTFTDGSPTGQDPAYLVLFTHGKRQPEGTALDAELAQTPGTPFAMIVDSKNRVGDAFIYEYRRDGG